MLSTMPYIFYIICNKFYGHLLLGFVYFWDSPSCISVECRGWDFGTDMAWHGTDTQAGMPVCASGMTCFNLLAWQHACAMAWATGRQTGSDRQPCPGDCSPTASPPPIPHLPHALACPLPPYYPFPLARGKEEGREGREVGEVVGRKCLPSSATCHPPTKVEDVSLLPLSLTTTPPPPGPVEGEILSALLFSSSSPSLHHL